MGFVKLLFRLIFTWWNNATPGTLLSTRLHGVRVGTDSFGNRYYQNKEGSRRWVLFKGTVEASRVPADWYSWLRKTVQEPPRSAAPQRGWEKQHQPNLTGTEGAYRPAGSLVRGGIRAAATGDYEPWSPHA
ncbi:MAG: NADH:ubiquinone oxidoreductase subunit NDUFA12 [Alphaproteobacteria bacterium]|nr:NADH:ubiquinone oxidoreductase subunit NDUFA12 [Alphaproteobacteria bacterium]